MDRTKAKLHRDKAPRLNEAWGVGAAQVRYSDDGNWYAALSRFPTALFDAHGYVLFATEEEYRTSPHIRIGKIGQIGVSMPGISAIPGYVRVVDPDASPSLDVDIYTVEATEGRRRLVLHRQRERNQTVVRKKKKQVASLDCEVCGFSFGRAYGSAASDSCEVHHLLPLSEVEHTTRTRMEDLAILCANCHRVVHLHNSPYTLNQVRSMLEQVQQELMQAIESDHNRAMEYVDRAHEARRRGDTAAAIRHFAEAFLLEKKAAEALVPYLGVEPTRSVLLRSAASLALECKRDAEAERLACLGLSGQPPAEIRAELRDVLMTMWRPASG